MNVARCGGYATIVGVTLLVTASMLHPMDADPHDTAAAFMEYARDRFWIATHLTQLAGAVLITAGFMTLSWKLRAGRAVGWGVMAAAVAVVALASAAALQAVDGIALKSMVDRWSAVPGEARAATFEAAVAVRAIEIGLASITALLFGLAVFLYGIAIIVDDATSSWLGLFGAFAGAATLASGLGLAYGGFSSTAMNVNIWSTLLALVWCVCAGVLLLRDTGTKDR